MEMIPTIIRRQKSIVVKITAIATMCTMLAGVLPQTADATAATPSEWKAYLKTHPPGHGCFEASFPNLKWTETTCGPPPTTFYTVGYTNGDWAGNYSGLGKAEGFISASNVSNEQDSSDSCSTSHVHGTNYYSAQMNTNFIDTNSSFPKNWVQFIFANDPCDGQGSIFIEYWLYNRFTCPNTSGLTWTQMGTTCVANTSIQYTANIDPTSSLFSYIDFTGSATSSSDSMSLYDGVNAWSKSVSDSVVSLSQHWGSVEFNVFGNGGQYTASFNTNSQINVQVDTWNTGGTAVTPSCWDHSWTGELNNMALGTCYTSSLSHDLWFAESH